MLQRWVDLSNHPSPAPPTVCSQGDRPAKSDSRQGIPLTCRAPQGLPFLSNEHHLLRPARNLAPPFQRFHHPPTHPLLPTCPGACRNWKGTGSSRSRSLESATLIRVKAASKSLLRLGITRAEDARDSGTRHFPSHAGASGQSPLSHVTSPSFLRTTYKLGDSPGHQKTSHRPSDTLETSEQETEVQGQLPLSRVEVYVWVYSAGSIPLPSQALS